MIIFVISSQRSLAVHCETTWKAWRSQIPRHLGTNMVQAPRLDKEAKMIRLLLSGCPRKSDAEEFVPDHGFASGESSLNTKKRRQRWSPFQLHSSVLSHAISRSRDLCSPAAVCGIPPERECRTNQGPARAAPIVCMSFEAQRDRKGAPGWKAWVDILCRLLIICQSPIWWRRFTIET